MGRLGRPSHSVKPALPRQFGLNNQTDNNTVMVERSQLFPIDETLHLFSLTGRQSIRIVQTKTWG